MRFPSPFVRTFLLRVLAVSTLLAPQVANAQQTTKLGTHDTVLTLQADPLLPRLASILSPRGAAWVNRNPERLVDFAQIGSERFAIHWRLNRHSSTISDTQVVYVYESQSPNLRLLWRWTARANFGPIEHSIEIQNLSGKEIWLPLQDSFQFAFSTLKRIKHLYVEKGADTPSAQGTHFVPVNNGYSWTGLSSTYEHKRDDDPREVIPFSAIEQEDANQTGWYLGVEFSGRTRIVIKRKNNELHGIVGLNPDPAPFLTRLLPGESFTTPTVFIGAYEHGPDGAGNILRRWVRQALGNPKTWIDPKYPLTVNNSWGSGTAVNEALALRMIADSAELGLEMFHLDAGWFRGVGDWFPDPKKFPSGLAPIARAAHEHGLKFGLWVDWTQAGLDTNDGALNARDPKVHNWLLNDLPGDWKPEEFKGQTIDIGESAAKSWAAEQLERMVTDFDLDMLEHDGYLVAQGCIRKNHPHAPPDEHNLSIYKDAGFYFVRSSNSSDVSYHAVRAYYDIYSQLRKKHPDLLLEICNDGGRMVDFGSAAHGDYFSITDTYDPLSNRRAFYDTSHVLPAAMLESYVEKWPTPTIDNFRYMLRSGMMGWLSVMQDSTKWSDEQHRVAKKEIELYKSELRPLIRDADLYHISARPDGEHWDGIEYFDRKRKLGVVYAFRGSAKNEPVHRFQLRGIDPSHLYRLQSHDGSSPKRVIFGRDLLTHGLEVKLPNPLSSQLVFFDDVTGATSQDATSDASESP